VYIVQGDDTLWSIAEQFEMFPDDFYAVNPALRANPNSLNIGQQLQIPGCETDTPEGTDETAAANQDDMPPGEEPDADSTTQPTPEPGSVSRPEVVYTVQSGDTLYSIATRYGVTVLDLIQANDFLFNENTPIFPNDQITIPSLEDEDPGAEAPPAATSVPGGVQLYTVQSGDNLFRIATNYSVTVQDLVNANDFLISENTPIHPGDQIIIP
jgi:LysM repeat protein